MEESITDIALGFVELKSIFQFIEVEIFTDVDGVLVLPVEWPNGHALLLPGG